MSVVSVTVLSRDETVFSSGFVILCSFLSVIRAGSYSNLVSNRDGYSPFETQYVFLVFFSVQPLSPHLVKPSDSRSLPPDHCYFAILSQRAGNFLFFCFLF